MPDSSMYRFRRMAPPPTKMTGPAKLQLPFPQGAQQVGHKFTGAPFHQRGKRAWIYCRTAYPDMVTLAIQEEFMIDYAKSMGFSISGVTSEHGSGLDFSREGIKTVLHAIEAGEVDLLLVKDLPRLGRDSAKTDHYLHWLKKHNVNLVCADGTEPQTYSDMLHRIIEEFEQPCLTNL